MSCELCVIDGSAGSNEGDRATRAQAAASTSAASTTREEATGEENNKTTGDGVGGVSCGGSRLRARKMMVVKRAPTTRKGLPRWLSVAR